MSTENEKSASPEHVEKRDGEKLSNASSDSVERVDVPPPPMELSEAQIAKLYRRIDLRLMPMLSLMYLMSFMDRGNIGNAKLQGLTDQLHLTGNKYNIALTMYFIPYCLFECPANLVLKKFRPSRWLPGITIAWGIVMTMMGLVKTYPQLVGVRICLGVAEAGLFPGVVYYLTMWYPRHEVAFRVSLFYGAASVAGAFSGLLAYGISFMSGTQGLLGWSWIFILEGIATVVVGIVACFVLVDFPDTAKFLSEDERAYVVWRKKYDGSSVGEAENFRLRYVVKALTDWQLWLHILIYMSIVGPVYGISLFLPSIINGFGFNKAISQLLTVPPYVFATALLLTFSYLSDRWRRRSTFILAGQIMAVIGFAINISNASRGAKYFGTFLCVGGTYAAFPSIVSWLGNNVAGQYKRGVSMAAQIGIGNFSGAIASNIFRSQDAPRYILGHGLELGFLGMGLIVIPIVMVIYTRINKRRDEIEAQVGPEKRVYTVRELRELGDRAPEFRYTL